MKASYFNINSAKLFQLVFHFILWSVWMTLPIINAGDNERFRNYAFWLMPFALLHIPLFLINSEILIPKVLNKRSIGQYLLSLILLMAIFSIIQYFLRDWVIPESLKPRHSRINPYWAIVPVIFVTAISTAYGFIIYLVNQEKAEQEQQKEQLKSELSFLRSQISPHFIFNILNSIVYLIRSRSDLAEPVTIKLSELVRYMLYTSDDGPVTLEQEVDYLRNYVELQKIRFEEDVEIKMDIKGQFGHQQIEPMLLIPFVENAFKHGVGMLDEPEIEINLKYTDYHLQFLIRNKIAPQMHHEKDSSSGIGLKNVRRRLELLYPNAHLLEVRQDDSWFSVELHLDCHQKNHLKASNPVYETEMSGY